MRKPKTITQALLDLRDEIHELCVEFEKTHRAAMEVPTETLAVTGEIRRSDVILRLSLETNPS